MNQSLNETIKAALNKHVKTADNITYNSVDDHLAFMGKVGYINLVLDDAQMQSSCREHNLNFIKLYNLMNQVVVNLFKKHRNFLTMRSHHNSIIGYFNLREDIDYNLLFELATMINAYRLDWSHGLSEYNQVNLPFSLYVGFRPEAVVSASGCGSKSFFKKEHPLIEDYLIFLNEPVTDFWKRLYDLAGKNSGPY